MSLCSTVAVAITVSSLGCGRATPTLAQSPAPASRTFDRSSLDTTCAPCRDFFQFANGGWLARTEIPGEFSSWGSFNELYEHNLDVLHDLLEAAARDSVAPPGSNRGKLGRFYGTCMDSAAAEAAASRPLQPELDRIGAVNAVADVQGEVARLQRAGIAALFNFTSDQDAKQSTEIIAEASQGGLGLPDRDYYTKTDSASEQLKREYVAHMARTLELLGTGVDEARTAAQKVMAIETALAQASMTQVQLRDPNATYHKMTAAALAPLRRGHGPVSGRSARRGLRGAQVQPRSEAARARDGENPRGSDARPPPQTRVDERCDAAASAREARHLREQDRLPRPVARLLGARRGARPLHHKRAACAGVRDPAPTREDRQAGRPRRVGHDAADGERLLQPGDERDRVPGRDPPAALFQSRRRRRDQLWRDGCGDRSRADPPLRRRGPPVRRRPELSRLGDEDGRGAVPSAGAARRAPIPRLWRPGHAARQRRPHAGREPSGPERSANRVRRVRAVPRWQAAPAPHRWLHPGAAVFPRLRADVANEGPRRIGSVVRHRRSPRPAALACGRATLEHDGVPEGVPVQGQRSAGAPGLATAAYLVRSRCPRKDA